MTTGPGNPGQDPSATGGNNPADAEMPWNFMQDRRNRSESGLGKAIGVASLAVLIAGGALYAVNSDGGNEGEREQPTPEEVAERDLACGETWAIVEVSELENNDFRWYANGMQKIKEARVGDGPEAWDAAVSWFDEVKHVPQYLTTLNNGLRQTDIDPANLVGEDGCVNESAVELALDFVTWMSTLDVEIGDAPVNFVNTGLSNGQVTTAEEAGISGEGEDVKACIFRDPVTGAVIFAVLGRCGQPVFPEKPELPEGPTDEEEKPDATSTTMKEPPATTTTTVAQRPTTTVGDTTVPGPKNDDGELSGDPSVPADQDPGTPDVPGPGPSEQTPTDHGNLPHETLPPAPTSTTVGNQTSGSTTAPRPPATTGTTPPSTNAPVPGTAPPTSNLPGPLPQAP